MDADVPRLECAVVQSNGEFPSPTFWKEVKDIEVRRRIVTAGPGFNFRTPAGKKLLCLWRAEARREDGTRLWAFNGFQSDSPEIRTVYVREVPQATMALQCQLKMRPGDGGSCLVMNFRSESGKPLGAAVHQVNMLPPRIDVQEVTRLSRKWAAAAGQICSRNQCVDVVLDGFAAPLAGETVLWKRRAANKVRRRLHGKTCVASRWFDKRLATLRRAAKVEMESQG